MAEIADLVASASAASDVILVRRGTVAPFALEAVAPGLLAGPQGDPGFGNLDGGTATSVPVFGVTFDGGSA